MIETSSRRPFEKLVGNPMDKPVLFSPMDLAVTFSIQKCHPEPAAGIGFDINFLSKTQGKCVKVNRKHRTLTIAENAVVGDFSLCHSCFQV